MFRYDGGAIDEQNIRLAADELCELDCALETICEGCGFFHATVS